MSNSAVSRTPKPFGYWLKRIDSGIEDNLGALLSRDGLTRRGWQVLNCVVSGPIAPSEVDRAMAPFFDDSDPTAAPYLRALADRAWIAADSDGVYSLTEAGRLAFEALQQRVSAQRAAVMQGLTREEFATLVELLRRVAANVDAIGASY